MKKRMTKPNCTGTYKIRISSYKLIQVISFNGELISQRCLVRLKFICVHCDINSLNNKCSAYKKHFRLLVWKQVGLDHPTIFPFSNKYRTLF